MSKERVRHTFLSPEVITLPQNRSRSGADLLSHLLNIFPVDVHCPLSGKELAAVRCCGQRCVRAASKLEAVLSCALFSSDIGLKPQQKTPHSSRGFEFFGKKSNSSTESKSFSYRAVDVSFFQNITTRPFCVTLTLSVPPSL